MKYLEIIDKGVSEVEIGLLICIHHKVVTLQIPKKILSSVLGGKNKIFTIVLYVENYS